MATGLRDEIKTMQGSRRGGRSIAANRWISLSLSLSFSLWRPSTGRGGWNREDREGGERPSSFRASYSSCSNSGNCLSSKRDRFLHKGLIERVKESICMGMIFLFSFLLCSEAEPESCISTKRPAAQHQAE